MASISCGICGDEIQRGMCQSCADCEAQRRIGEAFAAAKARKRKVRRTP